MSCPVRSVSDTRPLTVCRAGTTPFVGERPARGACRENPLFSSQSLSRNWSVGRGSMATTNYTAPMQLLLTLVSCTLVSMVPVTHW